MTATTEESDKTENADEKRELFRADAVAVITGAASGIGRAAAERCAHHGMRLALFDRDEEKLAALAARLPTETRYIAGDVSVLEDVERLRDLAVTLGAIAVVMNNAAIGGEGSDNWTGLAAWRRILDVNLWGVIHGTHVFAPVLLAQTGRAAIINTGSKQGITNPPGFPAYAVAKAGVKTLTEQLAHGLRNAEPARGHVTAHLLVPGWTFTGMTHAPEGKQPVGSWTAEQVVERMVTGVEANDFYLLCEDGVVTRQLDAARIAWSAGDLIENRPALSRWHPEWADDFDAFVKKQTR